MATRNTLNTLTKLAYVTRVRRVLSVSPVLLTALMLGLQQDHSNTFSSSAMQSAPDTNSVATAQLMAVDQSLLTAIASPLATPAGSSSNNAQKTEKNRSPNATSMTGARVALANFVTTNDKTANSTWTTDIAHTHFQFNQTLKQTLFTAVVSSPFAIGFGDDARTAIWNENPQFAFVSKADKFVIMLDPGHGGTDPGSVGHNGLQEKTLTLDIAKRAERLLSENKNLSVILTRNSDAGMSRNQRVHKVKRSQADMFVSIHLNHLPQTDVNLVETFYAAPHNILESIKRQRAEMNTNGFLETTALRNPNLAFTHGSKKLASIMQKRVFDEVIENNPETDNAGVKADTLFILTRSFTPGALIELSCLSNVQEAERLNNPAYRQKLALALAQGIRVYLDSPAARRQFGPGV